MQKPDDCVRRSRLYVYAVWTNDGRKLFALRDERGQGEEEKTYHRLMRQSIKKKDM